MLNERGGVIDDLIVYYLDEQWFRMVVNAGTAPKDLEWLRRHAATFGVSVTDRRDLAMLAVQGPNARNKALALLPSADRDARCCSTTFFGRAIGGDWFVARTGYTGEDGFEIMMPADRAVESGTMLLAAGVKPVPASARATRCASRPA
jgi:aminomethyltransferase